jgi:hypothetical protein
MEGFVRWSWIQIDELAEGAFHHPEGTLPVDSNSLRRFTERTNYLFGLDIYIHLLQASQQRIIPRQVKSQSPNLELQTNLNYPISK